MTRAGIACLVPERPEKISTAATPTIARILAIRKIVPETGSRSL
jgi:hypothetical protein